MSRPSKSVRWNNQVIHNITRGTKNREAKLQKVLNQLKSAKVQDAKKRDLKRPHVPIMVDIPIPNFFVYYTKNHEIIRLELRDEQDYAIFYKLLKRQHNGSYSYLMSKTFYENPLILFLNGVPTSDKQGNIKFIPCTTLYDTYATIIPGKFEYNNYELHHFDPFDTLNKETSTASTQKK